MSLGNFNKLILENPEISVFRFFEFSFSNKIQERLTGFSNNEKDIINRSLLYKRDNEKPFWESFFYTCINEGVIEKRIFNEALYHNKNNLYIHVMSKDLLLFLKNNNYSNLAINSQVELNSGSSMHIPMLDFKISSNSFNLNIVRSVLESLNCHGNIFNSGKSFHFIGFDLISKGELIELLSKFILFHPISDKSWAAHQIIEGSASLRVSNKYGMKPCFVDEV